MGLNHSQIASLPQKQGWKCVCNGFSLKGQGEEEEEKELSLRVPPGPSGVPTQDRGHGLQLSDAQRDEFCCFSQP